MTAVPITVECQEVQLELFSRPLFRSEPFLVDWTSMFTMDNLIKNLKKEHVTKTAEEFRK